MSEGSQTQEGESPGFKLIEDVPEETVKLGLLLGLMRIADDGIAELTEKGRTYLHEWCQRKIAGAKA